MTDLQSSWEGGTPGTVELKYLRFWLVLNFSLKALYVLYVLHSQQLSNGISVVTHISFAISVIEFPIQLNHFVTERHG